MNLVSVTNSETLTYKVVGSADDVDEVRDWLAAEVSSALYFSDFPLWHISAEPKKIMRVRFLDEIAAIEFALRWL